MKETLQSAEFQKKLLWVNGSLPALFLFLDWYNRNLGANPPESIIRTTGVVAIVFLVLTLSVSPIVKMTKWSWIARHRRWLGLFSFYYALLHLLTYAVFDKSLSVTDILVDIKKRPFILLGFTAFVLMIPLAITSTNNFIRKLGGKKWKDLHQLTYPVAILATVHFWMIVKSDIFYPAIFAVIFSVLLLYRIVKK